MLSTCVPWRVLVDWHGAVRASTLAAGLRYAAARFAAFEASLRTDDLRCEKAEALDAYLNEFRAVLDDNLDQYSEQQSKT